ncbi:uncharacterized protein [Argopecten irradians]|uniref:uncharacterized protein n=1 Tax=Argopecten irradians TaxID=31199 RepID=UPI003713555D
MAHFEKTDTHFSVFFQEDKTIQIVVKDKVVFGEDEHVKVLWKTSNITDDGRTVVEDMPYEGVVIFSGSLIKCRNFKKMAEKEINLSKEENANNLISSGKEMKLSSGKRGASIKLKRALKEETGSCSTALQEESDQAKQQKKEVRTKPKAINKLKLKEMAAFAGLPSPSTPQKAVTTTVTSRTPGNGTIAAR